MSERCLKVWENVWNGLKDLRQGDRRQVLEAIFAHAFDGEDPKLSGTAAAVFKIVRPLLAVYDSGKAFSGSLGGAVGGSAKSAAMLGNSNASKTQAKRKQNARKTQALQNENENGNKNLPPKSPDGGVGDGVRYATDGKPEDQPVDGRYPDPISREEFANLVKDMRSVHGPAGDAITDEEAAEWWNGQRESGWTVGGRQIRGASTVRQLLAGLHRKNKKISSARAVEPAGGSARVFTLQEDEE